MLWKRLNPGDKNVVTFLFLERWKQLDFGTSHALNFRSQNYLKKVLNLGQKFHSNTYVTFNVHAVFGGNLSDVRNQNLIKQKYSLITSNLEVFPEIF